MPDFYATEYPQDQSTGHISSKYTAGRVRHHGASIVVAGDETAEDRVYCGALPSNCVLLPISSIFVTALTASVADIGGDAVGKDKIVDGLSTATAGQKALFSGTNGVGPSLLNKPLWQVLGFSADPGGMIDIWLTWKTAPTAAGTALLSLFYATE